MKRVLVIEDDDCIRESLRDLLEDDALSVVCASNGQEGLDYLQTAPQLPSLILLDLMMPVMDGYVFKAEQAKDPRLASIPVVMMTADNRVDGEKMRAQVSEFLRKPLDIDTLLHIVHTHCA